MKCPYSPACAADLHSPAEQFLHRELHQEPFFDTWQTLRRLPYILFPRIARLMEDYHREMAGALQTELEDEKRRDRNAEEVRIKTLDRLEEIKEEQAAEIKRLKAQVSEIEATKHGA